ncbi:hypothetical protein [Erysipelothrix larvae]|nr:hypothetical protein [Erysipelothrix larvae]
MEYGFLFTCILCDLVVQSLWTQLSAPIEFVSQMSFMGLILSIRNDEVKEYGLRFLVLCLIMNLFHYDSYPVYLLSFGISVVIVKYWYRHIGSSFIEWLVIMTLALFIREFVMYLGLVMFHNYVGSFMFFMAKRGVWVILINLLLFKFVMNIRSFFHGLLIKRTRRDFQ